ncbi:MAG TPA: hypothetical protein VJW23_14505, partial [Propionibacteriaceae bacterium]|nr:hypothetical protein [Propionibacteriaceae bacterium]
SQAGAQAAGKSATPLRLVEPLRRVAVIDVDDIRHLVIAGHAVPWEGSEGRLQQRIGVENAWDLARRYLHWSIDVVLSDVLNYEAAALYRHLLPGILIVQLWRGLAGGDSPRCSCSRPAGCQALSPSPWRTPQSRRGVARAVDLAVLLAG